MSKVYEANTDIDDFLACAYGFFIRRQQTISLHSANFLEFKFKEIECFKYSRMTFFNHQLVVATSSFTLEFLDQDFNCLKKIPVKNKILFLTVLNNELISADNCNYICFWSAKGVMRKQYGAHSNWTLTCLTTMGDYLLTSSFDKTICFWEPDGTSYSINLENPILQLATNQTQIIMNLQDTSLILWDLMGTKPNPNYSSADPLTLTDRLRDALKRKFSIISSSLTQRLNFGFFKT
ncbi:MAG: hypothetical protein JHC93_08545 [Parachlamydiales bacterium]|nr:hypothetical protein [Parachlamydiales bacterium]